MSIKDESINIVVQGDSFDAFGIWDRDGKNRMTNYDSYKGKYWLNPIA